MLAQPAVGTVGGVDLGDRQPDLAQEPLLGGGVWPGDRVGHRARRRGCHLLLGLGILMVGGKLTGDGRDLIGDLVRGRGVCPDAQVERLLIESLC